jgi:hypothetical protein
MAGDLAVSNTALAEMGLASMQPLSDNDGLAIRGKGLLDGLFGIIIPGWPPETPDPAPAPHGPPTGPPPAYQSPFGEASLFNNPAGFGYLGNGPAAGPPSVGFQGNFPWPLGPM